MVQVLSVHLSCISPPAHCGHTLGESDWFEPQLAWLSSLLQKKADFAYMVQVLSLGLRSSPSQTFGLVRALTCAKLYVFLVADKEQHTLYI